MLGRYVVLKTLICVAVGVVVGAIFSFVAAPLSFLVGLLTCFANYFPFFGLIGVLLPMPLLMLDPSVTGSARALAFLLPLGAHLLVRMPSSAHRHLARSSALHVSVESEVASVSGE